MINTLLHQPVLGKYLSTKDVVDQWWMISKHDIEPQKEKGDFSIQVLFALLQSIQN